MTWYQQEALGAIQQSIDYFCPRLGRWPRSVQLKQQKTRWGSCGISEKIYINWLLILAPPGVLEYVVAHELCHLFHRNHGKRFWAKVAQCYPGYEQHETWLGRHGQMLMPLG
jgi:predicted metal-dependent hydrolase